MQSKPLKKKETGIFSWQKCENKESITTILLKIGEKNVNVGLIPKMLRSGQMNYSAFAHTSREISRDKSPVHFLHLLYLTWFLMILIERY
jgi:hypothetical protein